MQQLKPWCRFWFFLAGCLLLAGLLGIWSLWLNQRSATDRRYAMTKIPEQAWPHFADDLPLGSLRQVLDRNIAFLAGRDPAEQVSFGLQISTVGRLLASQQRFRERIDQPISAVQLDGYLRDNFQVFEAAADWRRQGNVLVTGYYVPHLQGSRQPDERFCYPLYRRPADLVRISLNDFDLWSRLQRTSLAIRWLMRLTGRKVPLPSLVGRLTPERILVPYFSREEIDYGQALAGHGLELVWVDDDIERFFLHIQGSGRISLAEGGELMVGYAGANGWPYRSIGAWLIRQGYLEREAVTMPAIRAFLLDHPDLAAEILTSNPSYVFFRSLAGADALGCWQVPLTAGRSIATDKNLFPAGGLAYLLAEKPEFAADGTVRQWQPVGRLVINQDTGGAIAGNRRVDLFCGFGREAAQVAGVMKQSGRLFFLAPR